MKHRSLSRPFAVVICAAWFGSVAVPETVAARHVNNAATQPDKKNDKKTDEQNQAAPRPRDKPSYFLASQVDWVPLIAPPPEVNSAEQQRDLQTVLDMQAANGKGSARREMAVADTEDSCFRIVYVLDPKLEPKQTPKTAEFLKKAANEGDEATALLKVYWKRARPFVVSDKVERLGDIDPEYIKKKQQEQKEKEAQRAAAGAANGPGGAPPPPGPPPGAMNDAAQSTAGAASDSKLSAAEQEKKKLEEQKRELEYSSYPSGHATYGTLCAIFIAQMVPEKQAQIFKRADEYRQSRLIVGAHFPTDIEAGRIVATAAAAVMSQNFAFQRDLAVARTELRAALGLPAELPSRQEPEPKKPQP